LNHEEPLSTTTTITVRTTDFTPPSSHSPTTLAMGNADSRERRRSKRALFREREKKLKEKGKRNGRAPKPRPHNNVGREVPPKHWACSACTYFNPDEKGVCSVCNTNKNVVEAKQEREAQNTPIAKKEEDKDCSVCLSSDVDVLLDCLHAFCSECIQDWSKRDENATCPLCRTPLNLSPDSTWVLS
jgi:hypothetical protein